MTYCKCVRVLDRLEIVASKAHVGRAMAACQILTDSQSADIIQIITVIQKMGTRECESPVLLCY